MGLPPRLLESICINLQRPLNSYKEHLQGLGMYFNSLKGGHGNPLQVFLPEESYGQRSPVGPSPLGPDKHLLSSFSVKTLGPGVIK